MKLHIHSTDLEEGELEECKMEQLQAAVAEGCLMRLADSHNRRRMRNPIGYFYHISDRMMKPLIESS